MTFLDTGATTTRCEHGGPAGRPTIVLVHEMGGTLESWDGVVDRLSGRWRTLRYDLRGAGMAEKLTADVAVETLADDLSSLLSALGERDPVYVAGAAVGAAVALCFAVRHPGRAAAVAIISPSLGVPPEAREERSAFADAILAGGMRAAADDVLGPGYPAALRERDPARFEAFRARWLGHDPASYRSLYRMLIALDGQRMLAGVRCPILGIGAKHDAFRPPAAVEASLRDLPDARFVLLDAGHHAAVQDPDGLAEALHAFFSDVAGERSSVGPAS